MEYQEWTPCELYGHAYEIDEENQGCYVCGDCGDSCEKLVVLKEG